MVKEVDRGLAAGDIRHEFLAILDAASAAALFFQAGLEMARKAHGSGRRLVQRLAKGGDRGQRIAGQQPVDAAPSGKSTVRRGRFARPADVHRVGAVHRRENLDSRTAGQRGGLEGALAPATKRLERALDVLAGAEPVDPPIRATAGILAFRQRADLHVVGAAAGRTDMEGSEVRLVGLEEFDVRDVGQAPPAPPLELVGVRRLPALEGRRTLLNLPGLASRFRGPLRRHAFPSRVHSGELSGTASPGATR